MSVTPKGVRMINGNVIQQGYGLVITDPSVVTFNELPNGSLYIHPTTGQMMVKIAGESDWIPAPDIIRSDGTILISRDTAIETETFTVITTDNGDTPRTFTYETSSGQRRTKPVTDRGFLFELEQNPITHEKQTYLPGRNHLVVVFDDVLERSAASGGIIEVDETRFIVTENIPVGTEVTAKYIKWVRIGNPYPRIYLADGTTLVDNQDQQLPGPPEAEVGDFFFDHKGVIQGYGDLPDNALIGYDDLPQQSMNQLQIPWENITGKPTTLSRLGITDQVSLVGHRHSLSDINDLTAKIIRELPHGIFQKGMIIDWKGSASNVPGGWAVCDGRVQNGITTPTMNSGISGVIKIMFVGVQ